MPYQYGIEARALESLWEIFALARKAMKDHPGCERFASLATRMLNVRLRPVTAKWHRAHQAGLLVLRLSQMVQSVDPVMPAVQRLRALDWSWVVNLLSVSEH